jgi:hypothetical protein
MRKLISLAGIGVLLLAAHAVLGLAALQESQPPQGPRPTPRFGMRGEGVFGTIASVGVDQFAVKKADGSTQTVIVDEQTRFRQGQQEIQLEDLKPGDRVMVRARTTDSKEFVAALVRRVTEEEMARLQNAGERAFGEIVSIEKDQLRLRSRFQGERVVAVNDQTSFLKDGQPITLKDLKVGDRVFATGKEIDGKFVATRIATGQFRRDGRRLPRSGGPGPQNQEP